MLNSTNRKKFSYDFGSDFFNITSLLRNKNKMSKSNRRLANICLIFLLGMFVIIYNMMGGFLGASWGKYFSYYSEGYENIMLYFVYIFYAISAIALIYFKHGYLLKSFIAAIIIGATALITNTKMMFISLLLLFLSPFVFSDNNKFTTKRIIVGVVSLIGVLYLVNFFYILRTYGNFENIINNLTLTKINVKILDMISNSEGELGVRNAFYLFIDQNNNFPDFNQGHTYIRLLMMGIPTQFSFNLKPTDFTVSMGSAFMGDFGNTIFTMHPTLYGDSFANFWWFGIFLGVFWALFANGLDKYIHSKIGIIKDMLMVATCTCYIMIGRGSIYNSIFTIVLSILIILFLNFISRLRIRSSKTSSL
jgi:hypothetical protein